MGHTHFLQVNAENLEHVGFKKLENLKNDRDYFNFVKNEQ